MIPNAGYEQRRQHGIQQAYLTYEIIAEGGLTRLMAIFKDVDIEKLGPIRSSRHYFLDYVLENDALYIHWGGSNPYAYNDIAKLKINNLDGMNYDDGKDTVFWRDTKNYSAPNNGFISTKNLKQESENKNYRLTSDDYELLNYQKNKVDLSKDETVKEAKNITIKYPVSSVRYEYVADKEYYLRFNNKEKHVDKLTNEQVHVKNILVLKIENKKIPGDTEDRQNLFNIGSGEGYFITNGQSIEITWNKHSRESKTIYKNKKGEEIVVNDGNTFIQIQPIGNSTIIE